MTSEDIKLLRDVASRLVTHGENVAAGYVVELMERERRTLDKRRPLTDVQANVLAYLREFSNERGYAPSQQELCERFGWRSMATPNEHLANLEAGGHIARTFNTARGITIL